MKNPTKSLLNNEVFNLMDALRSPVLTHSSSWADCIPGRLLEVIPHARLGKLYKDENEASDPEIVAFMMTASMEFPLSHEWTDIYTHYACKVAQEYWQEDHWESVKAPREISKYDQDYHVRPLRKHIYDKRRQILKERMKDEETRPISPIEVLLPQQPELIEQQLQLF